MPLSETQRALCDICGMSYQLVEDIVLAAGKSVCPKCEESTDTCKCDLKEFPFGLESVQGPVSNPEMNRKKDIKANPADAPTNRVQQNFNPAKQSASQKEAEREKALRDKMSDAVQDDLGKKYNTKNDDVTFYPSTDHQK